MYSLQREFHLQPDRLDLSELCEMLHDANVGLDMSLEATISHLRKEVFANSMFTNMVDFDGEEMRNLLDEIKTIVENDDVIEMDDLDKRRRENATDSNCSESSSDSSSWSDDLMAETVRSGQRSLSETSRPDELQFKWKSADNLENANHGSEIEDIEENQQSMIFTVSSSTDLSSSSYGNCDADNDEVNDGDGDDDVIEVNNSNATFENFNKNNSNNNENYCNKNNKDDNSDDDDEGSELVSSSLTSVDEDDINLDVQRWRDLLQVKHAVLMTKRKYCFWHAVKNFQLAELDRYWSNTKLPIVYERSEEREVDTKVGIVGLAELLTSLCFKLETVILLQKARKNICMYKKIDTMMLEIYKNHCDGEVCHRLMDLWRVETDNEEIISFSTWNSKKEWYLRNLWACLNNSLFRRRSVMSEDIAKTRSWQPETPRNNIKPKYGRRSGSLFESQSRSWRKFPRYSSLGTHFKSEYRRNADDFQRYNLLRKSDSGYSGSGSTISDYCGRQHWKESLMSKKLNFSSDSNGGHYPKYSYMARRRLENRHK